MSNKVFDLSLYLVLDPVLTEKLGMVRTAELAVQGGATIVQLRAPQWKKRQRYECALKLKTVLDSYHVPLIIDDDIDIALAVDADGVHVGQKDLPADVARRLMGKDKIVGLSINNEEQMNLVDPMTVNYVGIGPVFSTLRQFREQKFRELLSSQLFAVKIILKKVHSYWLVFGNGITETFRIN